MAARTPQATPEMSKRSLESGAITTPSGVTIMSGRETASHHLSLCRVARVSRAFLGSWRDP